MGFVCEHEFEIEDTKNPGFSLIEYDLYAKLDLTLRKNIKAGKFELMKITSKKVMESFNDLQSAVRRCNELEEADNTEISCRTSMCSKG